MSRARTMRDTPDLLTELQALQVERRHFDPEDFVATPRRPVIPERGMRPARPPADADARAWRAFKLADHKWRSGR